VDHATAVIHAYLPGPDGGVAIAETLFGVNNPSGRLSFTYVPTDSQGAENEDSG
jgi:beta-glucosidase